jgi:hypothetical protein
LGLELQRACSVEWALWALWAWAGIRVQWGAPRGVGGEGLGNMLQ